MALAKAAPLPALLQWTDLGKGIVLGPGDDIFLETLDTFGLHLMMRAVPRVLVLMLRYWLSSKEASMGETAADVNGCRP